MESAEMEAPSHRLLLIEIRKVGDESRVGLANLSGKMDGRFNGLDQEIAGIRNELSRTGGRVSVLETDGHGHDQAPAGANVIEEGLPFAKGWARKLALAAIIVAAIGGLKAAAVSLVQIIQAIIVGVGQYLQTPPAH